MRVGSPITSDEDLDVIISGFLDNLKQTVQPSHLPKLPEYCQILHWAKYRDIQRFIGIACDINAIVSDFGIRSDAAIKYNAAINALLDKLVEKNSDLLAPVCKNKNGEFL